MGRPQKFPEALAKCSTDPCDEKYSNRIIQGARIWRSTAVTKECATITPEVCEKNDSRTYYIGNRCQPMDFKKMFTYIKEEHYKAAIETGKSIGYLCGWQRQEVTMSKNLYPPASKTTTDHNFEQKRRRRAPF